MKRIIQLILVFLPIWALAQEPQWNWEVDCGDTYMVTAVPDDGYHFVRWSDGEFDNPREVKDVAGNLSFVAEFASDGQIEITTEKNLGDLDNGKDVVVMPGGKLIGDASGKIINTLIIQTDGLASGQVCNFDGIAAQVKKAFMEYRLNPAGTEASPDLWYAFAVPFPVNVNTGITRKEGCGPASHVYGSDFLIMEYDGQKRADTGKGWKRLTGNTLYPGRFYLIGIDGTCNNWLFEKTADGALLADKSVDVKQFSSNNPKNSGLNGIANPSLEHLNASGLSAYTCLYDNTTGTYGDPLPLNQTTFVVGQPFFIQAGADATVNFAAPNSSAPSRYTVAQDAYIRLTLSSTDAQPSSGWMYISLHESTTGEYTIGRDFARMDNDATRPHLWCENYGMQLTAHGITMPEEETVVPVVLFVPTQGDYQFSMHTTDLNDYDVELLYQGKTTAQLYDDQALTLTMAKGSTSDYSIRIRKKAATGLTPTLIQGEGEKMLINGNLYIFQGGHVYDAQGAKVK